MRQVKFENGDYGHIYNRGVDKRVTFMDNADFARFLHVLYICNDVEVKTKTINRYLNNVQGLALDIGIDRRSGQQLVEISCFCLMSNHYHLLLRQLVDDGISKFMHRVGTAYTMSFNKKNERRGSLFQGPFKAKKITSEGYLMYLTRYIHLNPLKLLNLDWANNGVYDWDVAMSFLKEYKWSSCKDYLGIRSFSSIIDKGLVGDFYEGPKQYEDFIRSFAPDGLDKIKHMTYVQG